MSDGNKLLDDVSSKYGAPMGRPTIVGPRQVVPVVTSDVFAEKVRCFRVALDSGGYDSGGAYWGVGPPSLYCAMGDDFQAFERAHSRDAAKEKFRKRYPNIKFYR